MMKEMMQMREREQTRRRFLQVAGIGAAASLAGAGASCGLGQPSAGKEQRRFEIHRRRVLERRLRWLVRAAVLVCRLGLLPESSEVVLRFEIQNLELEKRDGLSWGWLRTP
ncbi:hypothetical protein ES703_47721 [subsurface metagenome]